MSETVYLSLPAAMPELCADLERVFDAHGHQTLSHRQLDPAQDWPDGLLQLMRRADLMVTVLGPDGPDRWQRRDREIAGRLGAQPGTGAASAPPLVAVIPTAIDLPAAFAWPRPWVELDDPQQLDQVPDRVRQALSEHAAAARGASGTCPYPGLRPFTEAEACLFHGRERALEQVTAAVQRHPFTLLSGAPGSGKRSLVQAGLFPAVSSARTWECISCQPRAGGFHALATALLPLLQPDAPPQQQHDAAAELGNRLEAGSLDLSQVVGQLLQTQAGCSGLLVHLDGLELLASDSDTAQARAFLRLLQHALRNTALHIIATVSSSAQHTLLASLPELAQAADWHCLGALTRRDLRQAIEGPAAVAGLTLEPGFSDAVSADAEQAGGHPGLLACALRETWARRDGDCLHLSDYIAARGLDNGIEGCFVRAADAAWDGLSRQQRGEARQAWERLAQSPGQRQPGASADGGGHGDRLSSAWPTSTRWGQWRAAFDAWRERLDHAIAHWQQHGERPQDLLRGADRLEAMAWLERQEHELSEAQIRYISAARRPDTGARGTGSGVRRRLRRLVAGLGVALGLSLTALAFVTTLWWLETQHEPDRRTATATATAPTVTAADSDYVPASTQAPQDTTDPLGAASDEATAAAQAPSPAASHQVLSDSGNTVTKLAFSDDSEHLVTATDDGGITLWSLATGTADQRFQAIDPAIAQIKLLAHKRYLAALGRDTSLALWQPPTPRARLLRQGQRTTLTAASFNPAGKLLAIADTRRGLNLYQTLTGKHLGRLAGHLGEVIATAFAPGANADGGRLASAGESGDLWLWDLATLKPVRRLMGHRSFVDLLSFDASGETLLSAGGDGQIRLWDGRSGQALKALKPKFGRIVKARFAPAGSTLAVADSGGNIELWNSDKGTRIARLEGHTDRVRRLAFNPDASWLASASREAGVRLWSLTGGRSLLVKPSPNGRFAQLDFSPDGRWLAAAGDGGSVHLWAFEALLKSEQGPRPALAGKP